MSKILTSRVQPEPPIEPREPGYICCDECGGEIYEGETAFLWEGKTICSYCYKEKFSAMDAVELAAYNGDEMVTVGV